MKQMENANIAQIKKSIEAAQVVSFDVFDTLIVRITARPEDVFELMEHITGIKNFASERENLQMQCSIMVENTRKEPHATFDDIYKFMEEKSSLDTGRYTWEELKELELEVEKAVLVQNKPVYELFSYARSLGKRVILTSDMYLGKAELLPILRSCGYSDFDGIYVSADVKKTKYRLDLFAYVVSSEAVPAEDIVHIGDNYEHDVVNARKCGLKSELYEGNRNKEKLSLYRSICAGVSCCLKNRDESFWYRLGAEVGGPLYCGLIDSILDCIKRRKPEKLFFLARDGYNLYHLFNRLKLTDIQSQYMYSSRRAMLLCGIKELDKESLKNLPPYTFGQSVKEILDYLDISDISEKTVKDSGFDGFDDIIKTTADIDKFKNIFVSGKEPVLKKAEQERKSFEAYLTKLGFTDSKALVFDCGWNGSSQYLLDRALSLMDYKGENSFIYAGLMNSEKCRRQLKDKSYEAILFDANKNNSLYKRLERSIVLLELFFGAPHGSVWKYADNAEGYILEDNEGDCAYKEEILRGILDCVEMAYPLVKKFKLSPNAEDCLANVYRLIEYPTEREATEIGNIENPDGFVRNSRNKIYIAKLTAEDIKNNPNELYWPQGIYMRKDIPDEVKKYVRSKTGVAMPQEKQQTAERRRPNVFKRVKSYIDEYGFITTAHLIKEKLRAGNSKTEYELFIQHTEKDILHTEKLDYKPLISFVVPVYNVLENQLRECIESILNQTYDNYELILVDDKSTWEFVPKVLAEYESNPKITVIYRKENGHISRSTNTGIEKAKGEYIAFADCDDVIAPNAVYEITKLLNKDKTLDFIYSDEDKLTDDGKERHSPFFKPDWSPDTFVSYMYTSHLSAYRRSIVNEIGGLRVGFEGAQDYDFTIRFTEKSQRVGHIPKVLYHWRQRPESVASDLSSKPYVMKAMLNLKKEMLERRNLSGEVVLIPDVRQYRVIYNVKNNAKVSIIIPSKDNYEVLKTCIMSIVNKTKYNNYEIIVVDNGSNAKNKKSYSQLCEKVNARYHYEPMTFNFSKMCNIGAAMAEGQYLLFLNDDTEVIEGDWLRLMAGQAGLDHCGAVGAKLLYPNSSLIQHCGIINLPAGPSSAFAGMDDNIPYYFSRNKLEYDYLAVTAACLCVDKSKFEEVGGFDTELEVAYNDVDLCFKLYEKGYHNCVRADARLYHYESLSRGIDDMDEKKRKRLKKEKVLLYTKHSILKDKDPYYNVNLAKNRVDFAVDTSSFAETSKCIGRDKNVSRLINDRLKLNFDIVAANDMIELTGWAFIAAMPFNNLNRKGIVLLSEVNKAFIYKPECMLRFDVTRAFGKKGNLNLSGFKCSISRDTLPKGRYRLGVMLENPVMLKKYVNISDRYVDIY